MGHVKVIQSGNYLEIYQYEKSISPKVSYKRPSRPRQRDKRLRYARLDNVNRRVKGFARLVRSNLVGSECPFFLTLTMYESLGIQRSYELFSLFISRLRRNEGDAFRYIAVPEFQKRGAVHFRVLIWGLPLQWACTGHSEGRGALKHYIHECTGSECERSTRYFQNLWQAGFVDSLQTDGSPKLAGYLAKYMYKSMQDVRLLGEKSYCASRNVYRPTMVSTHTAIDFAQEVWGVDLSTAVTLQDRKFETQWLGVGRYRLLDIT